MMVDATFGDPPWLYRRMPHPVVLIGRGIGWLERRLLRPDNEAAIKRLAGVLLLALVLVVSAGAALAFKLFVGIAQWGWIAEGLVMGALLAQRSLVDHVRAVAHGLRQGLTEARREVALIVGRDPDRLDRRGRRPRRRRIARGEPVGRRGGASLLGRRRGIAGNARLQGH